MTKEAIFEKDIANKKMIITRTFDAELPIVWEAWTKAEILDQWWAPKPFKAETKSQEFREGGMWHYCMVGPEGEKHWCRADYKTIDNQKSFSYLDAFCDENAVPTDFPHMHWMNSFSEKDGETLVHIDITFEKEGDMEKIIEMGFKEGFTAGMTNLDEVLAKL
jgi:uncharacterized protein YndB with AHSA1/START domain